MNETGHRGREANLQRLTLIAHALVIVALFGAVLETFNAWPLRVAAFACAAAPLGLATPGLARRSRYTCQWLAILLVVYIGFATLEAVAQRGSSPFVSMLVLLSALELGCVLVLSRTARHQ